MESNQLLFRIEGAAAAVACRSNVH
jgi:hypothetical protein